MVPGSKKGNCETIDETFGSGMRELNAIGNSLGSSEEGQINADDLRTTMLLARNIRGKTACQLSVMYKSVKVLETLLDFAKQIQLNPAVVTNE
jgi:hypothetical protein